MIHGLPMTTAALLAFATATTAAAQPVPAAAPFSAPPISDRALNDVRGAASPYALLTRGTLGRLADAQSRSDFRVAGSVAAVQMDVWWGTIGSELIATAVRGQ